MTSKIRLSPSLVTSAGKRNAVAQHKYYGDHIKTTSCNPTFSSSTAATEQSGETGDWTGDGDGANDMDSIHLAPLAPAAFTKCWSAQRAGRFQYFI